MTPESIIRILLNAERAGRLIRYSPIIALRQGEVERRTVWLHPTVANVIGGQLARRLGGQRVQLNRGQMTRMQTELRRFVRGDVVVFGNSMIGHPIKPISSPEDGLCEFKFRTSPQVRLFGGFAHRDVYVGTHIHPRDGLDFPAAKAQARNRWSNVFQNGPERMNAGEPTQLLSNVELWEEDND